MTQIGPFVYEETYTYQNPTWTTRNNNLTGVAEDTMIANFEQSTIFKADNSVGGKLNTELVLPNPGSL